MLTFKGHDGVLNEPASLESSRFGRRRSESSPAVPIGAGLLEPFTPRRAKRPLFTKLGSGLRRIWKPRGSTRTSEENHDPNIDFSPISVQGGQGGTVCSMLSRHRRSMSLSALPPPEPGMVSSSSVRELRSLAAQLDFQERYSSSKIVRSASAWWTHEAAGVKDDAEPRISLTLSDPSRRSTIASMMFDRDGDFSSARTSLSLDNPGFDFRGSAEDDSTIQLRSGPCSRSPVIQQVSYALQVGKSQQVDTSDYKPLYTLEVQGLEFVAEQWEEGQEGELRQYLETKLRELMGMGAE
ncbi:hypothetical protein T439DRAFT_353846 [Meredithblackwellia eburnea MCA 4105]